MKLRICGDSLRLRLKRAEVNRIASGQIVEQTSHIGESVLKYRLEPCDEGDLSAGFNGGEIIVYLPKTKSADWIATDEVSLYSEQAISESGFFSILVEKDFACLEPGKHRDCSDDDDTYSHPKAQS